MNVIRWKQYNENKIRYNKGIRRKRECVRNELGTKWITNRRYRPTVIKRGNVENKIRMR